MSPWRKELWLFMKNQRQAVNSPLNAHLILKMTVLLFSQGKYTKGIYMICDEKEYWALGTEAWFNASRRTTLNDGINTREKLKSHDPELAQFLEEIYGNGDWRYDFTPYQADSQG